MTEDEEKDEFALLAQIRATPHDVLVRRRYADLVSAHDAERGEYTRIALQDTWGGAKARYDELSRREPAWAAELGLPGIACQWRRGLPSVVSTDADAFVSCADALARLPIANLTLSGPRTATVERLCACLASVSSPALERLALLSVRLGTEAARLFESRALAPLRSLHVRDDLGAEVAALGRAEHVHELRVLELPQCRITDAGVVVLASSLHLASLEELHLQGNELGREGVEALAQTTSMPGLRRLSLADNPLRSGGQHYVELSEDSDGVSGWYDNRYSSDDVRGWFRHRPDLSIHV